MSATPAPGGEGGTFPDTLPRRIRRLCGANARNPSDGGHVSRQLDTPRCPGGVRLDCSRRPLGGQLAQPGVGAQPLVIMLAHPSSAIPYVVVFANGLRGSTSDGIEFLISGTAAIRLPITRSGLAGGDLGRPSITVDVTGSPVNLQSFRSESPATSRAYSSPPPATTSPSHKRYPPLCMGGATCGQP